MNKLRVLITDDSQLWQKTIKLILETNYSNLQIEQAETAAKFEELIDSNSYDLVIFDLGLPVDENALRRNEVRIFLELLGKLRSSEKNRFCAVIVLSGHGEISNATMSVQKYKAFDYFEKDNFPVEIFTKAIGASVLESRFLKTEERIDNRCRLTINLNKSSVVNSFVDGPKISASYLPDRPDDFDCDYFSRRCDGLSLYFNEVGGTTSWRTQARDIGKDIYNKLFADKGLLENLYKAQANAKKTDDLWICLQGTRHSLGVHFELMHNKQGYLSHKHIFTRKLNDYDILNKKKFHLFINDLHQNGEKLKVLIVGSNSDGKLYRVEDEIEIVKQEISNSLNHIGIEPKIKCLPTEEATYQKVTEELKTGEYHIFHFSGHGEFVNASPEESGLWLLDKDGTLRMLNAQQLYLLTLNSNLQFVFLNCCLSAVTAGESGRGDYYGIFEALVQAEVPAVLGYRWTVMDESALQLARKFYQNLWRFLSLEDALHIAKHEIKLEQGLDDEIWASPILLLQKS